MIVLALETATRRGSVALLDGETCHAHAGDPSVTHGARLPAELTEWVSAHGRNLPDLDLLAVIVGPGSFTGLRVGIAAMQAVAMALHRRVAGVSTLDALAFGWLQAAPQSDLIVPCLDGQRGDVFFAVIDARGAASFDDARVLVEPAVALPEEAMAAIDRVLPGRQAVIVGDGGRRHAAVLASLGTAVRIEEEPTVLAAAAARLAARHPERAGAPHALRPVYLRRPDAVLARERAGAVSAPRYLIRRASGADDVAAVERLQRQTFTNPWGAEAIRWELEHTDVARLFVLQVEGGPIVAYCACWMVFDELHINSLAVDPARRRQGLARRLLQAVLAEVRTGGARSATLEVRQSNGPARALYESLGFRVEAVRRDYYQEPREDALILWKRAL